MALSGQKPAELPLNSFKGVGEKTAAKLAKLGLESVQDLLFHLPMRYEDRTRIVPIGALKAGQKALIQAEVALSEVVLRGRRSLLCRISDGTGFITLRFFYFSMQQSGQLVQGVRLQCFGEVRWSRAGHEMVHPEYRILKDDEESTVERSLTPVYPLTDGVQQKTLRKLVKQSVSLLNGQQTSVLQELLPPEIRKRLFFPPLAESLRFLHAPDANISIEDFENGQLLQQRRLVFEELLAHHLSLSKIRNQIQLLEAPKIREDRGRKKEFLEKLPFDLTEAQERVAKEVGDDLVSGRPMMRLVQGDVGSGKTVVAALATLSAVSNGYQVALMAPTELLAEQHLQNFSQWLVPMGIEPVFLSGRLKGRARESVLTAISDSSGQVAIGTHALFQEQVEFKKLGLVIIDEQHRFGVHQRLALRDKGKKNGIQPHQLVMTATPIPRTLAMMSYADLDVSVIDQLPPGRTEVVTTVISSDRREEVIAKIDGWVKKGRQGYWVCTLIEESEKLQCEAAEETAERLQAALPQVRIGLVHGRMKVDEKNRLMNSFKEKRIDLLVATTVIEVGVDVPNAGLMVIENSERLGLSQLHQLRGRVGRGVGDSYCLLLYQAPLSKTASERLSILRESTDGFYISEQDLKLRGPGEVLGTRQTGQMQFRVADLMRDEALIPEIVGAAEQVLNNSPDLVQPLIDRWLGDSANYGDV